LAFGFGLVCFALCFGLVRFVVYACAYKYAQAHTHTYTDTHTVHIHTHTLHCETLKTM